MPYYIYDIRNVKPQSGFCYLFDANIWLAILDNTFNKPELRPYISFFNSIINETEVDDAEIGIPCLLLSEVINRMIKDIHYKEYSIAHPFLPGQSSYDHLKNGYRKSADYKLDLEAVCSSIRQYHRKIKFISDNLNGYAPKDIIKKIPVHLDINDYLYSKMALEQGLVIVTNDSDFDVENIHIYTKQYKLLNLMT